MEKMNLCGYLMDKITGGLIGVNRFGFVVALLYQQGKNVAEIIEYCQNTYEISTDTMKLKQLISIFIKQMEQKGLTKERLRLIRLKESFQLLTAQLDLSWDCNLHCRHCYLGSTKLIENPLTKEEWQGIIDQLYDMDVPKIVFLGGEPILANHFFDLSRYATKQGFKIFTTSNGTLITAATAHDLVKSGFNEIDISLDGATNQSHEFLRGHGTFAKTLNGIKHLISTGLIIKTATVLNSMNAKEVKDILLLGKEMGINEMYFNPLLPGGRDGNFWNNYVLTFEEWLAVKKIIRQWNRSRNKKQPKAFAESGFDFSNFSETVEYPSSSSCNYVGCKAGKREMIITPDGFIAPCPLLSTKRQFQTMNIRQFSLNEIWGRDEWIIKLRGVNEYTLSGKCKNCKAISICQGGCHVLALFEYGDICQPDPRCPYTVSLNR